MRKEEERRLRILATNIRMGVLKSTHAAKSGHPGGSLSSADIIAYLYEKELRVDPKDPSMPDRDRFVLSKGHAAPALYAALAEKGFFPKEELLKLRHIGSFLQGHPSRLDTPGVDMSTGSLGQGVSAACGMALGLRTQGKESRVYALLGDGELAEGEVWEAMMFAAHYKLSNLLVLIDNNNLQIDGAVSEVMNPYPIDEKLRAFGLSVTAIDGHDYSQIEEALSSARLTTDRPSAVILRTVKGKGVSFMENEVGWHGKGPGDADLEKGLEELSALLESLKAEEA